MRKIRYVLTVLLIMSVIIMDAAAVVNADNNVSAEDYIEHFLNETKCNSVSVAVCDGASVSYYGEEDGLYQIGSMTKAFTGLAIQKLISEGKIRPDNTVAELLPGYTAYYDKKLRDITVDHLLTQTSGYTNSETDYPGADKGMSLQEWAYSMSGKELKSIPGERYSYSNVNFNLLGAIIERVTGETYKDYMEKEILTPLGLTNTYVIVDPEDENVVSGSRLGYRHAFRYEIPVAEGKIPAGYFYSNIKDMARWIRIWLGTEDIPEEYKEMVTEIKAHLNEEGDYYSGWEVSDGNIGHSGGTPNCSSRIVFENGGQTGVCVLTNLNVAASTDSLCNGIFKMTKGDNTGTVSTDVWTVFDIIFSAVSAAGVLMAGYAVFTKKRKALLVLGIVISLLVISTCIVMPLIFGAGLKEIMFNWAPYSFTGGLVLLAADIVIICIKLWMLRKNAHREKTS